LAAISGPPDGSIRLEITPGYFPGGYDIGSDGEIQQKMTPLGIGFVRRDGGFARQDRLTCPFDCNRMLDSTMKFFAVPTLAALAFASPTTAQDSSAPAVEAPADGGIVVEGEKEDPDADKVVCKTERVLGSRLSTTKRCQTRRQWKAEQAANRQDVERVQNGRWKSN
jgi:hypothetical protein